MKRWIGLLALSLAIGVALTWIARPLEVSLSWGDQPDKAATLRVTESIAKADWSAEEKQAIAGAETTSRAFVAISKKVSPSVVTIASERVIETANRNHPFGNQMPDDFWGRFFRMPERIPQRGMGSGVIVSPDGLILTNNHVVANADRVQITFSDGRMLDAEVLGVDEKSDVAVVKVDATGLDAASLGNSDAMEVGEWVLAIGSPFQLTQTVTAGIVSAKGRSSVGLADYEDFIQTDAAINPGNSGGALVNLRGEVVGINTAIASRSGGSQGVGFAIPINMAQNVMNSLMKHGRVVRGYLGVTIQNVDAALAENYGLEIPHGALVNSVQNGTPAADAGIKAGDLIVGLNDKELRDRDDLRLQISGTLPETPVELTLLREGREKKVTVRLAELKDENLIAGRVEQEPEENPLDLLGFTAERINRGLIERFDLDPTIEGLLVVTVEPASAASDAGLREGDIILEAGRTSVSTLASLKEQIEEVDPGRTLLMKVRRGEANIYLALRTPKS